MEGGSKERKEEEREERRGEERRERYLISLIIICSFIASRGGGGDICSTVADGKLDFGMLTICWDRDQPLFAQVCWQTYTGILRLNLFVK